jgi:hypothetical protein
VLQDIVVGRHRDVEDRISWFLGVRRFEAALTLAEADRSLNSSVWETVVQVHTHHCCWTTLYRQDWHELPC